MWSRALPPLRDFLETERSERRALRSLSGVLPDNRAHVAQNRSAAPAHRETVTSCYAPQREAAGPQAFEWMRRFEYRSERVNRAGVSDRGAGEKEQVLEHPDDLRPRLNADRRRQFGQPGRMLALVCECADSECRSTVLISAEEYDSVRPDLVLYPGHEGLGRHKL